MMLATARFLLAAWVDLLVGPFRRLPAPHRRVAGRALVAGFVAGGAIGAALGALSHA